MDNRAAFWDLIKKETSVQLVKWGKGCNMNLQLSALPYPILCSVAGSICAHNLSGSGADTNKNTIMTITA